jgi:hypothetical protein
MTIVTNWPLSTITSETGTLIRDDSFEPFWAKITGNNGGTYSWKEQAPQAAGTWIDLPQGRTGNSDQSPAFEQSSNMNVPVGVIVKLSLGFFNQTSTGQEYLFNHCCTGS